MLPGHRSQRLWPLRDVVSAMHSQECKNVLRIGVIRVFLLVRMGELGSPVQRSPQLLEADKFSLLSESPTGHVDAVLADEALAGAGDAAAAGILAVLPRVGVQLLLELSVDDGLCFVHVF